MKKGWEIKTIGNVCEVIAGQSPEGKFYNDKGNGLPFYQGKKEYGEKYIGEPTTWTTKVTKEAEANDILMSVRAPVGPINFATQKICIGRGLAAIRATKLIDKEFLFNFLLKHENEIVGNTGAVFNSINKAQIEAIEIPLPPLPEQQRIVAILDEAFAAIAKAKANAEQNLKNAKELFESYLQGVFENKGEGWVNDTLEKLLEKGWIISHLDGNHGGDYPKKEEFKSEGVPYISANCLRGTNIDFSLAKHLSPEKAATFRKGVAINNDVLFAHNATVGPVAILKTEEEKVILGTSLTYYRCNTEYILPEYLANYMRSKEFKQQYEIIMRQSTRNQVPITKQREFYHIIPPIDFQKQIIINLEQLLEQSQKLEVIYQQKINDLEELKKSVLQKAFAGELRTEKEIAV